MRRTLKLAIFNTKDETGQAIVERDAGEEPHELWKKTLQKAEEISPEDKYSPSGAARSQDKYPRHSNAILQQHRPNCWNKE